MSDASAGFWSYAHEDDERDGGRIKALASAVTDEYSLLTGRDLTLFIDRDIDWGNAWRSRIDEALSATTFFISVVTPRYFSREECRRELLTFAGHAKSLGREELLLPIYYVTVAGIDGDPDGDEAMELVSSMQWSDWRDLRLESADSSAYRRRVSELAGRLAAIAEQADQSRPVEVVVSGEHDADDDMGTLDLVAQSEAAFPRFNQALEDMGAELERVSTLAEKWTPILARASEKSAGAALHAVGQFSEELGEPAERLETLGREYSSELVRVDPGVLTLIRQVERGEVDDDEARGLFQTIRSMGESADAALAELTELTETLAEVSTLSRDLKRPLRKMQDGVKNVLDGRAVLDEWRRRAEQVEKNLPDLTDEDPEGSE